MRIYIAGPYTADTAREVQANVNRAIAAWCALKRLGHHPYCPHLAHYLWMHPDGDFDWKVWIDDDLVWLRLCDAIYLLPGWERSEGANIERSVAIGEGLRIFERLEDVVDIGGGNDVAETYEP